ncbi:hypothetical protein [Vibrio casei]|uniref:Flagellar protein FliL n=1 Tax=Vibrio casei TaxID=673372 RepID=A0A368LJ34_9VIBR|nr:hypothetical protein [Vibrio casei]RCS70759.1 hypothetical protein CIK83_15205 [Vibrio casei]SJN25294.1 hypothetical protein FM109_06035 [Vibrio casei]
MIITKKKWAIIAIVLLLLAGSGGFLYAQYGLTPIKDLVAPSEPVQENNSFEVLLTGTLIPVNDGKRQKLLLLDLSMYSSQANQVAVEKSKNHIRHALLNALSVKPTVYFYDRKFVSNLQKDVEDLLIGTMGLPISEVLVTKAIYQ